jgi:hypothetical protein
LPKLTALDANRPTGSYHLFVGQASVFTHPFCLNTFRNGVSVGSEAAATGY